MKWSHIFNLGTVETPDAYYIGTSTSLPSLSPSIPFPPLQLLVAHNAPLFVHNLDGQTPCDVAWKSNQIVIAKQLESKMVLDVRKDVIGWDELKYVVLFELLVWPHEVEPRFYSWYRGRVETLDALLTVSVAA